jgi:hypothetical protein
MRRRRALTAALAMTMIMTGCHTAPTDDQPPDPESQTRLPADDVVILTDDDAGELALRMSRLLFDRAPVVVLTDPQQATTTVADMGVPLLLTPDDDGAVLRAELARLEVETLLTVGDTAADWARAAEPDLEVVAAGPAGTPQQVRMPATTPLTGLAVLTPDTAHTVAAVATARAAGARVLVTGDTDPRGDPAVIAALAEQPPTHTIALGADFGPTDTLRQRLAVAATGVELPGGGQLVFPGRILVALYGHPGSSVLGALGEQPLDDAIARAQQVAAAYQPLVDEPVVPTMEIITTIASASPGPAGDYSSRTPVATLVPWVEAAWDAGMYVVLDLQPGHTDFLTQAQEYEELLRYPHVGLALDPEWRLAPHQRHMVNIGSVDADEVNQVVDWLADLTATHALPQKLLILHQFTLGMITNRVDVDTGRDEVAVLIHADGFGTHAQKLDTWRALLANNPPDGVWWGWKNFYDEDRPTMTPAETVAVEPLPRFISYQ